MPEDEDEDDELELELEDEDELDEEDDELEDEDELDDELLLDELLVLPPELELACGCPPQAVSIDSTTAQAALDTAGDRIFFFNKSATLRASGS